jgi:flagella basal body P-ring formation protein FlgA
VSRVAVAAAIVVALATVAARAVTMPEALAAGAVVDAVTSIFGGDTEVTISDLQVAWYSGQPATGPLDAKPEPGVRLGRVMRFSLWHRGTSSVAAVGYATGLVDVRTAYLRAARDIARGTILAREDVEDVVGVPGEIALRARPAADEAIGARAVRPMRAGETITSAMVAAVPFVKSGDRVRTRITTGALSAFGYAIAEQSGGPGQVIRLLNPESRRTIRGRIVARGEVEVIHGR